MPKDSKKEDSPSASDTTITVRLREEDRRAVRVAAAMQNISTSEFVRQQIIGKAKRIASSAL